MFHCKLQMQPGIVAKTSGHGRHRQITDPLISSIYEIRKNRTDDHHRDPHGNDGILPPYFSVLANRLDQQIDQKERADYMAGISHRSPHEHKLLGKHKTHIGKGCRRIDQRIERKQTPDIPVPFSRIREQDKNGKDHRSDLIPQHRNDGHPHPGNLVE